jgi:hypothetical protein
MAASKGSCAVATSRPAGRVLAAVVEPEPTKPGSRTERQYAVRAMLAVHPEWADRRIGTLCGVSPRTVGRVRSELGVTSGAEPDRDGVRIGRDGRARPIDPSAQRARIRAALAACPEASLRDIARAVGASPETVRAVRADLLERPYEPPALDTPVNLAEWSAARERGTRWQPDHAFTSRDDLTATARFLERTDVRESDLARHACAIPLNRVYEVSDEARRRAEFWQQLAERVEARAHRKDRSR